MSNVKFIAFSGGCFSGKTTTMNLLKDKLVQNGIHVIVINENIRDFITSRNTTIEAIRKDANAYFQLQSEIITDKMSKELRVLRTKKDNQQFQNTVVLADRSMIDSLFYFLFYVDKNNLVHLSTRNYELFYKQINDWINDVAYAYIYDLILMFEPLELKCNDSTFRPSTIDVLKHTENRMIRTLHDSYYQKCKNTNLAVLNIDLNKDSQESVVNYIYNTIKF